MRLMDGIIDFADITRLAVVIKRASTHLTLESWPPIPASTIQSMFLFRRTLFFAFLSISIAASAPRPYRDGGVSTPKQPPSPPEIGWVYYIHSDFLDECYKEHVSNVS